MTPGVAANADAIRSIIRRKLVRTPPASAKKSSNDRWVVGSVAIITGHREHLGELSGIEGFPRRETAQAGKPSPAPRDVYRENPS